MRKIIGTAVGLAAIGTLAGVVLVYAGVYNIGADDPHWSQTYRIMEIVRDRSIKAHAANITVVADLNDQNRILAGAVHYSMHCAICHAAPGVNASDLAEGMYPKPPELTHVADMWAPRELFWIVKHGIKMSGMPSWADHGDDQLWNSVAFLQELPDLAPDDYERLLETAKTKNIGHEMRDIKMNGEGAKMAPDATPQANGTVPTTPHRH